MDVLRSAYRTTLQPYPGSSIQIPIVWFRCAPDAQDFPTGHVFYSDNWSKWHNFQEPPAETPWVPRPWANGRRPAGALGQHYCGPLAYFEDGVPLAARSPAVVRMPSGLMECCAPPVAPAGNDWGGLGLAAVDAGEVVELVQVGVVLAADGQGGVEFAEAGVALAAEAPGAAEAGALLAAEAPGAAEAGALLAAEAPGAAEAGVVIFAEPGTPPITDVCAGCHDLWETIPITFAGGTGDFALFNGTSDLSYVVGCLWYLGSFATGDVSLSLIGGSWQLVWRGPFGFPSVSYKCDVVDFTCSGSQLFTNTGSSGTGTFPSTVSFPMKG